MTPKNSDTTGNRTRDLPACSAVPQPTNQLMECQNNQQIMWNDLKGNGRSFIIESVLPGGNKESREIFKQNIWSLCRELSLRFFEYEGGVAITQPRHLFNVGEVYIRR
jgi:hypothetical protein